MDQETLQVLLTKMVLDMADLKKGLQDGRKELQGFKTMAQGVGAEVKKALAFAGVAVGIYEIAGALKSFVKEAALTGARTETLTISAEKIGETYKMSAASVQYFVDQAKSAGITTQESLQGVSKFLTSGLPLEQLKDLATRARDIAVVAGVNTSEAFNRIVQGIITGEQETLRRMMIQVGSTEDIYKRYAATLGKTKEELNSVEKAQAMLNEVMRLSAGFAGVAAEADKSVGKQLASMARYAEEAKNALWPLFQPAFLAGVQELSQGWKDLETWAKANKDRLAEWGREGAQWVKWLATGLRDVGSFIAENKELLKTLAELYIASKAAGWLAGLGSELKKTAVQVGITAALLGKLKVLIGGPWKLIIAVTLFGLYEAHQKIQELRKLAGFTPTPGAISTTVQEGMARSRAAQNKLLEIAGPEAAREAERRGITQEKYLELLKEQQRWNIEGRYRKFTVPDRLPPVLPEHETPEERAEREAKEAQNIAKKNAPKSPGKDGKGKAGQEEDLFGASLQAREQMRQEDLQSEQNYVAEIQSYNEKLRAEQERLLAEGLIDGQTYYARLQKLQQQETDAALALIEKKRQAQIQAHQDALAEIAGTAQSPEMANLQRRQEEAKHRMALAQLDSEAYRTRIEGEKKVTEELTRQLKIKKETGRQIEDLNLETSQLLGAISEQEAKLQKLTLDWLRVKQEAIDAGRMTPELNQALDANYQAKKFDASYAGQKVQSATQIIADGASEFAEALWEGGDQIAQAMDALGQDVLKSTFKLFFEDLSQAISSGIKSLVNSIAKELQGSSTGGWFGGIISGIGNWAKGLFGGGGVDLPVAPGFEFSAQGSAWVNGIKQSFGSGGILTRPTLFAAASGLIEAGEAGPEGFLPLGNVDGKLGVHALFSKPGPVQVTVNNNTGVDAKATATQGDNGELLITLERAVSDMVAKGGKLQQTLVSTFNLNKRFT